MYAFQIKTITGTSFRGISRNDFCENLKWTIGVKRNGVIKSSQDNAFEGSAVVITDKKIK